MPLTKKIRALACLLLLAACQPADAPRLRLLVDGQVRDIAASDLVPAHMLTAAAISFSPADRLLADGRPVAWDAPIGAENLSLLQLRRAVPVTIVTASQQITVSTAAFTVGEALREAGVTLSVRDHVEPPVGTPLANGLLITLSQARPLTIRAGDQTVTAYASAATVGGALAEAGIPLVGLDQADPSENDAFPSDGQIRVVRVAESVSTTIKIIPYETELTVTTELQPPLQDVTAPGQVGLSLERTRIRYADGLEVGRAVESASVIRPPQTRVARSSYWAAIQMYATSYSPCRSGTGSCLNGTSSGLPVTRGVVAMKYDWYLALGGTRVYIPGYGAAVVADVGGGFPDGRAWIDLGFSDADYEEWSGWVTVYFLAPAPLEIPWFLK
jgi:uncharacterized protein YabE (DUF348 family)